MNAHPRPVLQLAAAVALAVLQIGAAHAQAQAQTTAAGAAAAVPSSDTLNLDKVIVTGTSQGTSKMKTSVSVSTLDGDQILQSGAVSAAEVLRSVPGLRAESSGGESNANVGVRGIPISAGGARYIQFQEDGLPILQFGDIAFATPDSWLRVDAMLDRLEVVRGGSASTLATGAPGGIINFISKTGEDKGGSIALTKGLDYSHTRFDFDYGGRLAEKTRFQIGGFYRNGDGGRPGAAHTEDGGQIRGNITQELDNGFVRVSFKHLDDRTPTFLPTPVRFVGGQIQEIPGIDPRRAAFYNAGWPLDNTLNNSNGRSTSNIRDGLVSKTDAFGVQMEFNLAGGWKLQDNFRSSKNSGRFVGIFPGSDVSAAPAGTRFATGANAGSAYAGDRFDAVVFNTKVDDAGLTANDFKLSKEFNLGAGKLTATGGLYTSMQHLKLTWNFNQYSLSASDEGARLLEVPGLANGSPAFGGCCMNFQDSKYRTTAPYAILAYEAGALNLDASVRNDRNTATGSYYQTLTGFGGLANGVAYNLARPRLIDYNFDNTSYSLGANFRVTPNLALFARYSDGAAYNADRITFFNDPNLVNGSAAVIPKNEVRQFEGGVKWRSGGASLFATFFAAKTDEINVDLTTNPIRVTRQKFDSKGLELEGAYRVGNFTLLGGITFTDAEVTASTNAATVGKTPKRQAKVVYQLTPTYSFGPATLGASIVGTSKSMDDSPAGPVSVELPAFVAVNAFVSYAITPAMTASITANNLFDTIGYTESNDGRGAARSINGRTVKASLRYAF